MIKAQINLSNQILVLGLQFLDLGCMLLSQRSERLLAVTCQTLSQRFKLLFVVPFEGTDCVVVLLVSLVKCL